AKLAAPVRSFSDWIPSAPLTAPVRHPSTAPVPHISSIEPHGCGPIKNLLNKNHHNQDEARAPIAGGDQEEKMTGLGALQRVGVNVSRRELGVHEGRARSLRDDELLAWAKWVAAPAANGITNKAAFAAAKVRMGCVLDDVVPGRAAANRRDETRQSSEREKEASVRVERERVERANILMVQLAPADRAALHEQALIDASVWIVGDASAELFDVVVAAAERRLVLNEAAPFLSRDHNVYPDASPPDIPASDRST
ncbi:MAG: hypothetical protein ACREM8_11390, partial [Vulcanimicrobiaceae bacterium]